MSADAELAISRRAGWVPPDPFVAECNVTRFMAEGCVADLADLRRQSVVQPDWFWRQVVEHLPVDFTTPFHTVLDTTDGIPWAKWFVGGRLNVAANCADRHPSDASAVVWEGEDGDTIHWTYGDLRSETDALAALLIERGVGPGEVVGIYLPMIPEAAAAFLAIAKIGAVALPLFSGYGAEAVTERLSGVGAVALVTADGFLRRGRPIEMLATAEAAADELEQLHTTVVVPRLGRKLPGAAGVLAWPERGAVVDPVSVDSEHPLFMAYTSGTSGRPKAAQHVHAGWLVQIAQQMRYNLDCSSTDVVQWFSDMGWIMGPFQVTGVLALGATLALYEGAPDHPEPGRLLQFVARHRVSILGLSPTLVRSMMSEVGPEELHRHDLSALRILASTGEPWDERAWWWYFEQIGGTRCPVVNISGGTEVGGAFLAPLPSERIRPTALGGPALGMGVEVFDDAGVAVRDAPGDLVCTRPWPSMSRGLVGDPKRFLDTYWNRWPDIWDHGDRALATTSGDWFIIGRNDDTMKVGGKRVGPAEVESAVVAHVDVLDAAAVGLPNEIKGQTIWVYAVLRSQASAGDDLRSELRDLVAASLGTPFRPGGVRFVTALPKTRNGKLIRRVVRAVAMGEPVGDLSGLEDASALEALAAAR